MCLCISIYLCTYTCVRIYACKYIHMDTYVYLFMCVHTHVNTYICIHIYPYVQSFPRKNGVRLKKFSHKPFRQATRSTAAVFHLNWRTSRVHPKEGRPRATISHESRPGKPSFLHLRCSHEDIHSALKQITLQTRGLASL